MIIRSLSPLLAYICSINLQHYLVVQLFGYHIHPSIAVKDVENLRIADVGTGTGYVNPNCSMATTHMDRIWLTDLVDKFPATVQLDGLDLSFDATPPRDWLPPNMSLHHWDITTEVPEHLLGVYDVVQVRHFAFVLRQPDLKGVLDNLLKLLSMPSKFYNSCCSNCWFTEPGGYLQWTDIDVSSLRVEKAHPDAKADAEIKLISLFQKDDTRLHSEWVPSLPSLFKGGGFTNVESDVKEAPLHLRVALHECGMLATEVMTRDRAGGNEESMQQLQQMLARAAKENRDGSVLAFTRLTVIWPEGEPINGIQPGR
jgi:hypothetical protein